MDRATKQVSTSKWDFSAFKSGLTWRSLLAMIIAATIFIPTTIYVNLIAGGFMTVAAIYVIAILFGEAARFFGSPLTKQELFVIYSVVGNIASTMPVYYWLVYRAFFINTPVTMAFTIGGVPLPDLVPSWLAPPKGSVVYSLRTLIHPQWFFAISVWTAMLVLTFIMEISLSMFFSYLQIEVEELRFPLAMADAAMVTALTERDPDKFSLFISSFYPGLIYGFLLFSGVIFGMPILPLPWADLTWVTEKILPGALIGVATDPGTFFVGFLIPPSVTFSALVGSLAIWVASNSLLLTVFPNLVPEWTAEYFPGMNIAAIVQRSQFRVWISPQLGLALGLAATLVIKLHKSLFRSIRLALQFSSQKRTGGFPSLKVLLGMYLFGTLGSVVLHQYLIPEIPFYVPLLASAGLSFFLALVVTTSIGELGFTPTLPWPWTAMLYMTPYRGYPGWVFSPAISSVSHGGGALSPATLVNATKVAYLTETRPIDYYKGLAIALVLNLVLGFVFMDFFWRMAPIPSLVYPQTLYFWPLVAMGDSLWSTRQIHINPVIIMGSAGVSAGILALGGLLARMAIPFSPVALIIGSFMIPPYAITSFLGSVVGKYFLRKYLGMERWEQVKGTIVAGALAGTGIIAGIGISATLLAKASWPWAW